MYPHLPDFLVLTRWQYPPRRDANHNTAGDLHALERKEYAPLPDRAGKHDDSGVVAHHMYMGTLSFESAAGGGAECVAEEGRGYVAGKR